MRPNESPSATWMHACLKARSVSDAAQKVAQISQAGRKSTEEVITGMIRIREQMDAIAESMVHLSEQRQTIGQIIAAVEDLAAQSSLLAVNAAIEAAKAGEYGKCGQRPAAGDRRTQHQRPGPAPEADRGTLHRMNDSMSRNAGQR